MDVFFEKLCFLSTSIDVEADLKEFNEAWNKSDDVMKSSQAAHRKLLEAAKTNIVKAQGKQKEHYD